MNTIRLATVAAALLATPASAWEFSSSKNAMTDQQTAYMSEISSSGSPIGLKCFAGSGLELYIGMPFSSLISNAPEQIEVRMRVDDGRILTASATHIDGHAIYAVGDPDVLLEFFNTIGTAKDRVVVAVGGDVQTLSVKGTKRGVERMKAVCGM